MNNQPESSAWISCAERLPDFGVPVLLSDCKQRLVGLRAVYENKRGWKWDCDGVTGYEWEWDFDEFYSGDKVKYWQPLPPLPPNIFLDTHCQEAEI